MSHTQILHLDGHRHLAHDHVTIGGEECQDCAWRIFVAVDGSLIVSREGGAQIAVHPANATTVQIVKRPDL